MIDNSEVLLAKDDGHKSRWGLSRFSYFKDGQKQTLRAREIRLAAGIFFGTTALWALLQSPNESLVKSEPIPLKNTFVSKEENMRLESESIERSSNKAIPLKRKKVSTKFEGLMLQTRPSLEKIPPGLIVKAQLKAGASNGLVKAALLEPLSFNGDEILPAGITFLGEGSSTEERLNIRFTKVVFKDGTIQQVDAVAMDKEDNLVGLRGSKVSKYASLLAGSAGLSFLSGVTEGLQERQVKGGIEIPKSDLRNAALRGIQVASVEQSKEIISKWKESKTIISVPVETEILIFFSGN